MSPDSTELPPLTSVARMQLHSILLGY
jgi:hypothetical protein